MLAEFSSIFSQGYFASASTLLKPQTSDVSNMLVWEGLVLQYSELGTVGKWSNYEALPSYMDRPNDWFIASQAARESWKLGIIGPTGRHRSWGRHRHAPLKVTFVLHTFLSLCNLAVIVWLVLCYHSLRVVRFASPQTHGGSAPDSAYGQPSNALKRGEKEIQLSMT